MFESEPKPSLDETSKILAFFNVSEYADLGAKLDFR